MAQKSIIVKNYLNIYEEIVAAGAITPGHLLELDSAGKVVVHNSAGATVQPMFAKEDELQGRGIATAYASGEPVQVWIPQSGDQVYALLANGENAAIGSLLESNGDGTLRVVDADDSAGDIGVQSVVGVAVEAVDMSDSSGADPSGRIIVRIN